MLKRSSYMAKGSLHYHRILGVQPDATLDTIRRAYRTLMFEMKMHPDLGGNHDAAAEINEGYSILCERAKQAEYHRAFAVQRRLEAPLARPSRNAGMSQPVAKQSLRKASFELCPLCNARLPQAIAPESRCDRCHSPLDEPP